jgi:hypothetical protein
MCILQIYLCSVGSKFTINVLITYRPTWKSIDVMCSLYIAFRLSKNVACIIYGLKQSVDLRIMRIRSARWPVNVYITFAGYDQSLIVELGHRACTSRCGVAASGLADWRVVNSTMSYNWSYSLTALMCGRSTRHSAAYTTGIYDCDAWRSPAWTISLLAEYAETGLWCWCSSWPSVTTPRFKRDRILSQQTVYHSDPWTPIGARITCVRYFQ